MPKQPNYPAAPGCALERGTIYRQAQTLAHFDAGAEVILSARPLSADVQREVTEAIGYRPQFYFHESESGDSGMGIESGGAQPAVATPPDNGPA